MSKQIEHTITIERRDPDDAPGPGPFSRYRPTCSCGRYSAAWGWSLSNAKSRGRAHVERAKAADARRAGIIRKAAGAPVVGKHRGRS